MRSWFPMVLALVTVLPGCKTSPEPAPAEDVVAQYPDELQVEDLVKGSGESALGGMNVTVHYTGWLTTGQVFDSSVGKEPFTFRLGARNVIRGWDEGVSGMQVGGKRTLTIPARLAYGDRAVGSIPSGSRLIFEIELLRVAP